MSFWGQLKVIGPRSTPFDVLALKDKHILTSSNGINTGGPSHYSHGDWMLSSNGPIQHSLRVDGPSEIVIKKPGDLIVQKSSIISKGIRKQKTVKGRKAPPQKAPMGRTGPVPSAPPHPAFKDTPALKPSDELPAINAPEPSTPSFGAPMDIDHAPVFDLDRTAQFLIDDFRKGIPGKPVQGVAKKSIDRRRKVLTIKKDPDAVVMKEYSDRLASETQKIRDDSMSEINQLTSRFRDETNNLRAELEIATSVNRDAIAQAKQRSQTNSRESEMREQVLYRQIVRDKEDQALNMARLREAAISRQQAELEIRNQKLEIDSIRRESDMAKAVLNRQREDAQKQIRDEAELKRLLNNYQKAVSTYENSEAYLLQAQRRGFVPKNNEITLPTSTVVNDQLVVAGDDLGAVSKRKAIQNLPNKKRKLNKPPPAKALMIEGAPGGPGQKRIRLDGKKPPPKRTKLDMNPKQKTIKAAKERLAIEARPTLKARMQKVGAPKLDTSVPKAKKDKGSKGPTTENIPRKTRGQAGRVQKAQEKFIKNAKK